MKMARKQATHTGGRKPSTTGRYLRRSALAAFLLMGLALAVFEMAKPRPAQAVSLGIVISQVYGGAGCGTAGCSTYQNDFIELFNRSKTAVTCTGCSVQYAAATGTAWQVTALPATLTLQPGQYYLIAESFSANGVSPLPTPDTTGTIAMSATAAKVALVNGTTALSGACPTLNGTGTPAVLDLVGYGATANCFEGTGPAPAPSTTTAAIRTAGIDADNNATDFQSLAPTPRNTASTLGTPTAADGEISGQVLTGDGIGLAGVVINLEGTRSARTITDSNGFYKFDSVETSGFYTVTPARANYSFGPRERSFSSLSSKTEAVFTATASQQQLANPLDTDMFYVRQQYVDFLGREPDAGGLQYWTNELDKCGLDQACLHTRRVGIAAAFFMEDEYQQTGSFVYRLYKGALGRQLSFNEFSAERQRVIAGPALEQSKADLADQFVQREEFVQKYSGKNTAESFVDALISNINQTSGADISGERGTLIARYNSGGSVVQSRSLTVREAIENDRFKQAEYNSTFVLMEYFGYLKRDPDEGGYNFWLNVLNEREPGNYVGMVCSFVTSTEYQSRFASASTHNNRECSR